MAILVDLETLTLVNLLIHVFIRLLSVHGYIPTDISFSASPNLKMGLVSQGSPLDAYHGSRICDRYSSTKARSSLISLTTSQPPSYSLISVRTYILKTVFQVLIASNIEPFECLIFFSFFSLSYVSLSIIFVDQKMKSVNKNSRAKLITSCYLFIEINVRSA